MNDYLAHQELSSMGGGKKAISTEAPSKQESSDRTHDAHNN